MIADDVMADMVRIARALIKGFRSLQSYMWKSYFLAPKSSDANECIMEMLTERKPGIACAISSDFDFA